MTCQYSSLGQGRTGNTLLQQLTMCSDDLGNATFDQFTAEQFGVVRTTGVLRRVEIVPPNGALQPNDLFSIEIQNDSNIDLLGGAAYNLPNDEPTVISLEIDAPFRQELLRPQGFGMGIEKAVIIKTYFGRGD